MPDTRDFTVYWNWGSWAGTEILAPCVSHPWLCDAMKYCYSFNSVPQGHTLSYVHVHERNERNSYNSQHVTLLSVLGKLFTRVLNNRLQSWAENYGIYVEAQNGFRPGRGTTDSIFILHCLINKFLDKNKSLYTFFVDFSKAFDYVIRENLWYKMIKVGVNGKILTIIRSMYNCVKTKVFSNGVMSDPFYCSLGVRQGECLSPFLFSLYINDLEECLNVPGGGGGDGGTFETINFTVCRWHGYFCGITWVVTNGDWCVI